MKQETGSKTAIAAAMLRAAHQLLDTGDKILTDPVTPALLGEDAIRDIYAHRDRFFHPMSLALRSHIVLRSRYAEDCLRQACGNGMQQFIVLGAGLDTFAYRQPAWAKDLIIAEADHPASQAEKIHLLEQSAIGIPTNLCFTRIDLEKDDPESVFKESRIDTDKPVFIACLGVLVYLAQPTIEKIFRFTASLAPGTEFVFTASERRPASATGFIAERAAMAGEPWISFFSPDELVQQLYGYGFSQVAFLSIAQANEMYYRQTATNLPPPRYQNIIRAIK